MAKKIIVTVVCVIVAVLLIVFKFMPKAAHPTKPKPGSQTTETAKIVAPKEIPNLGPAGEYKLTGDTLDMEISEWPGYAPIIVANGGLAPNENSYFFQKHGFKLKITVSESEAESWQAINSGKMAFSVTTVDVLALYGSQLKVEVPVQLDFSRGADGILVTKDITSINQLKDKIVAVAQFTESDFLIRFLAQEAGLKVKPLRALSDIRDPESINLIFTETAFDAANLFVASVSKGDGVVSGAVTWSPKTVEIPQEMPDKVRLLTSNRNLLIVADIVIANAAFAKQNPKIIKGMVEGILAGVDMIEKDPQGTLPLVAKAFNISAEEARKLMQDVHLSNHVENLAFFSSEPGQTGNFNEIYYSAVYAYGKEIIPNMMAPEKLVNRHYLEEIGTEGLFAGQQVRLAPVKTAERTESLEKNPLLTKQIRFHFQPNSSDLDLADTSNQDALKDLLNLLKLTPGSLLMLRGHLDNSKVDEFKKQGEAFYRKQAVRAVEQSKSRAESVKAALLKNVTLDAKRVDTEGRGWDEPLPGVKPEENRRVEVQLFTLE